MGHRQPMREFRQLPVVFLPQGKMPMLVLQAKLFTA
jgi:hypothetical protein